MPAPRMATSSAVAPSGAAVGRHPFGRGFLQAVQALRQAGFQGQEAGGGVVLHGARPGWR